MIRAPSLLLALLIVSAPVRVAAGGDVDPAFLARLQRVGADTHWPAYLMLADQVDLPALTARLDRGNAPRALRHRWVVEALRAKAASTQPALLAELRRLAQRGEVRNVRPLWIVNAVRVEGKPGALRWLAGAPGVARVRDGDRALTIQPPLNATVVSRHEDVPVIGLTLVKADKVWAKGVTGKGRLVANIDSGVDGGHPALAKRWRGLRVPAAQAWFDPISKTTKPFDYPFPFGGHGTHTMGTICGDDGQGKQIGVAPGAEWVAVGMVPNLMQPPPNTQQMMNYFLAGLQWIADPDGNPATVTDVPDVVSNSWGFDPLTSGVKPCDPTVWPGIDACEAAGVAVVFAAGNFQTPAAGLFSVPADRITSPTNAFAVGAVRQDGKTVATFSARGPSRCDNKTVKPEVVAPGVQVESSLPGGRYSKQDGTSMATPHVAGAIALLREVNPDLTARRAKEILMATAVDLGVTGEDNVFGHGMIDVEAAYRQVLAERGTAQVSVVTTTAVVKRPGLVWLHLSATNYTGMAQQVWFRLELWKSTQLLATVIPPVAPVLPPHFTLSTGPAPFLIPVPATLPPPLIGVPLTFRASLRQNAKEISRAETVVTIR